MDNPPSFAVCFSPEDIHRDDHSELTESCCDDVDGLSHEDDFGIKRAADPYYYHTLDGSSRNGSEDLDEIRMHLVRKQETIDILSSKLSQCEVDIEALKAERAALVNELAAPSVEAQSKAGDDGNGGGGSMRDANAKLAAENARLQVAVGILRKSFQSYIKDRRRVSAEDGQAIAELQRENELLRRRLGLSSTSGPVAPAIPSEPKCKPDSSDFTKRGPSSQGKRPSLCGSERTGRTCPLDASDVTLPHLGVSLSALRSLALSESESESERAETRPASGSNESAEEETRPASGSNESTEEVEDDPNLDGSDLIRVLRLPDGAPKNARPAAETRSEDGEGTVAADCESHLQEESGELVVDFGEARRTKTALKRRSSLPDEAARNNPGGLLVDFGETRRRRRTLPGRWQSFKW